MRAKKLVCALYSELNSRPSLEESSEARLLVEWNREKCKQVLPLLGPQFWRR